MFGNFDLEKLFARSSEFRQLSMPSYMLFFYNDRNIKMVRKYVAFRVKRKTETKKGTNGPICQ